ncbi:MAG: hypothetical protein GYA55_05285 [SAR324 cluster bacterium]|uniref:Uncharacterized protein n=1 Tax=SAR324 cluster bacterium TaxID=2024889 RepID=A0A7X9IL33_9DELT|nr:hypothetical protein [SAR324 cluster bacterium]
MTQISISRSKATLYILIGLILILPMSSLIVSIIFHDDVTMDKPKIVEESIKGVVSLFISITAVMVANAYTKKETQHKLEALQVQVKDQLLSVKDNLIQLVNTKDFPDKTSLENSQADVIQRNYYDQINFKIIVDRVLSDLERIYNSIIDANLDIGLGCHKYSRAIFRLIIVLNDYIAKPETTTAKKIKESASILLALAEE